MALKDKLHVMVVDDHISSRMVTVEGLQSLGISQIQVAKDGREAFTKLVERPVHLIISDLYMPEIDGFKLIQAVRKHPKIGKTAVIILTGKKDQNVVATASRLGVNNVLSKPFTPSGLKMAIESIVGALN
ncbi:MAG: response regulator [Rhizobiaceae bacterium]|jgi:two-component system chemotaxis response regulator CheY|nr:response regulator [Rhizobiaceae bacterium]